MNCFDREARVLRCPDCGTVEPLQSHSLNNPERFLAYTLEPFLQEHAKCASFKDKAKARRAVIWAREMKRFDNKSEESAARFRVERSSRPVRKAEGATVTPISVAPPVLSASAAAQALAAKWGVRVS